MPSDYLSILGPLPDPRTLEFFPFKEAIYAYIRELCSAPKTVTYYFSTSGNNANSGLTPALAKQTQAEINTLIAAGTGNQRFLLKRGDQWNANVNITLNKNNIEIGSYGTGNLPWINRFAQKYSTGWTLAAGNRYTRAEATDTAWVRFQGWDDSKSTVVGKYLSRQTSAVNCEATSNSFAWVAGTLHVNLGGTNPNTVLLEGNPTSTTPGISVTGINCYVHDIRVDGFGQDVANPHTPQSYQIQWGQPAGEAGWADNCETYYGGTHLHAQFCGGVGNVILIENSTAGFSLTGGSGETIFNAFASSGGQEAYFRNCTVVAGTLPTGTAAWVRRAGPMYAHTSASNFTASLIIEEGTRVLSSAIGCSVLGFWENLPDATTPDQLRGFHIGEVTTGVFFSRFPYKNQAWINGVYVLTPTEMGGQSMFAAGTADQYFSGFMWNNYVEVDFSGQSTTSSRSYYNANAVLVNNCKLWHNNFVFRMAATTAFRFDFDTQSVDSSPSCEFFNNIYQSNTAAVTNVGLKNDSANLKNNAYFNIVGGADTTTRTAYGNDLGKVALPALVVSGTSQYNQALSDAGYTGIGLEYDANLKLRPVSPCSDRAPTIGPVDLTYKQTANFTGNLYRSQSNICGNL